MQVVHLVSSYEDDLGKEENVLNYISVKLYHIFVRNIVCNFCLPMIIFFLIIFSYNNAFIKN